MRQRLCYLALLTLLLSCTEKAPEQAPVEPPTPTDTAQSDAGNTVQLDTYTPPPKVLDTQAPTWPDDAALVVSEVQSDRLTVSWPPAQDNQGVVGYRVAVNGVVVSTVSGSHTQVIITPLKSATSYGVSVTAMDALDNVSLALETTAVTTDITAPVWPSNISVTVSEVTETTALLAWSAATDNLGVSEYRIDHGDVALVSVAEGTQTMLEGLSPWTEYELTVLAVDASGNVSLPTVGVTFTTLDTTPPTWPVAAAIETSDVTDSSVTLSWPNAWDNVAVVGYRVTVGQGVVVAATSSKATTVTVGGLTPGQSSQFTLHAVDAAGNASSTGPSVVVDPMDQTAPIWPQGASVLVSKLSPSSLTLGWSLAQDNVGVTVYRITQDGVEIAAVSTPTVDVQNLKPWSTYSFSVRAEDGAQNTTATSLDVTTQTPDISPPVWTDSDALAFKQLTPTSVTLAWPKAQDDVGVAHYTVYQDNQSIAVLKADTLALDVSGLLPWTAYAFRVEVTDVAGNKALSPLEGTLKTPDLSTPSWSNADLTASNIAPTAFTLSWSPASDDVGVVEYRVIVNKEPWTLVSGKTTSIAVTGVAPWSVYDCVVQAVDAAGNWTTDGPAIQVKTPDTVQPTWPQGAELAVDALKSTEVTISWPAATDDVSVSTYIIGLDGVDVLTVDGSKTSATVLKLNPALTYLLTLRALDPAGNESSLLKKTMTTPDGGPPTWPDAQLMATPSPMTVQLSWSTAVDDVEVTAYRVFQDGQQIAELNATELLVENLDELTKYTFKVEAGDAAGNWSKTGPSKTVTTLKLYDPGFPRLSTEQFHRALADVAATLWREGCNNKFGDDCDCLGQKWPGDCASSSSEKAWGWAGFAVAEDNYNQFTNPKPNTTWEEYSLAFPTDMRVHGPNELHGGYRRLDQLVFNSHTTSWARAVMTLANLWFKKHPTYWGHERGSRLVLEPCQAANDKGITNYGSLEEVYRACASDFIHRLGLRAFRQPLSTEEHALFMAVYDEVGEKYANENLDTWYTATRGLRNVMVTLLLSPRFLYRVELGDGNGKLTAWELASRLSFHFWNTGPDDELLKAAENGSLLTQAGYKAQVDRLYADPRAERSIDEFYAEFFRVEEISDIDQQDGPIYKKFFYHSGPNGEAGTYHNLAGGFKNTFLKQYLKAARKELINLGKWFTRTQPGTYEEMFRSNLHFLECQESNVKDQCYGAGAFSLYSYEIMGTCADMKECVDQQFVNTGNGWDGESPPIELPQKERAGLVTRISFLGHETVNARPIRRGLKIRDMLLCEPIPPPENCDVVKPPNVTGICAKDGVLTGKSCNDAKFHCEAGESCQGWDNEVTMTIREKVEEITEQPGSTCAGCHSTFINGFGHALNHFSSVGQYWEKEHMYTSEINKKTGDFWYNTHTPDQWKPINATGKTVYNNQWVTVTGAHELADFLAGTGQLERCWSREYFRFAMGRIEWDADQETIEALTQSLQDGATLGEVFKNIVNLPQFKDFHKPITIGSPGGQP